MAIARRLRWAGLVAMSMSAVGVATALADQAVVTEGAAGGSIAGIIRIDRVPPARPGTPIAKDTPVCGREAASEAVVTGPDRGLANVVVSLRGMKAPGPLAPTPDASIDQVGCRYAPHVQAVTLGTRLVLLNNDAVLHNVHANLADATTVFNVAMPIKGQKLPTLLKRPGILKLGCDAGHTWMRAYIHVFEHPFFAVTDRDGKFSIKNVPPGRYTAELWHEPVDDKGTPVVETVSVEVKPGQTTATNVHVHVHVHVDVDVHVDATLKVR